MNEIGNKIKELRKKKGLSQEELAESACVNLRTIQRIENNESEPRGNTLNQICRALDVNVEEILDYGKQTDNNYLIFFHLSVMFCFVFPLGNIILPMILWMTKKDKIIGLNEAGINLMNYQIIWTVFLFLSIIFYFLLGVFSIFFLMFIGLFLLNIILPVYFAFKISNGETGKKYPTLIKLIK
jgi:transcriptional regulator with XRE-family HTH domain